MMANDGTSTLTPQDQLIGEIISTRGLAQMVCFLLVGQGIVPRETVENGISALLDQWTTEANGPDKQRGLQFAVAAVRQAEFLKEFRHLLGGKIQ